MEPPPPLRCPHCNETLHSEVPECPWCGTCLVCDDDEKNKPPKRPWTFWLALGIVASIGLMYIAVAALYFLDRGFYRAIAFTSYMDLYIIVILAAVTLIGAWGCYWSWKWGFTICAITVIVSLVVQVVPLVDGQWAYLPSAALHIVAIVMLAINAWRFQKPDVEPV